MVDGALLGFQKREQSIEYRSEIVRASDPRSSRKPATRMGPVWALSGRRKILEIDEGRADGWQLRFGLAAANDLKSQAPAASWPHGPSSMIRDPSQEAIEFPRACPANPNEDPLHSPKRSACAPTTAPPDTRDRLICEMDFVSGHHHANNWTARPTSTHPAKPHK